MSLKGKRVLVTGADGFIGSHLTERLVREGARVRALVYYNSFGSWGWLDSIDEAIKAEIEVVPGDVRDPASVTELLRGQEIVFHLAALIAIPFSYRSPGLYVDANVTGTLNILQAARTCGTEFVVQTSTSEVYGTAQFVPMTEDHPLNAQSPYAATKIAADQLALSFCRSFGLPVGVIRPFNAFGPRQSARAVIPTIITQLANGQKGIKLGSSRPTRDFNYVADLADAFVKMAVAPRENTVGKTINVGTGFEISIGDLAVTIASLMGIEATVASDSERERPAASEVERLCADGSLAKKLIGWEPKTPGLEGLRERLRQTIEWYRHPDNLKLYKHNLYNV